MEVRINKDTFLDGVQKVQGVVEAKGSHESLLLKSEIYKNFYEKQLKKN